MPGIAVGLLGVWILILSSHVLTRLRKRVQLKGKLVDQTKNGELGGAGDCSNGLWRAAVGQRDDSTQERCMLTSWWYWSASADGREGLMVSLTNVSYCRDG